MARLSPRTGNVYSHCHCREGEGIQFIHTGRTGAPWGALTHAGLEFRLFRCPRCDRVALGVIKLAPDAKFPRGATELIAFYRLNEERDRPARRLPAGVSEILREADVCYGSRCFRASLRMYAESIHYILASNGFAVGDSVTMRDMLDRAVAAGRVGGVDASVLLLMEQAGEAPLASRQGGSQISASCVRALAKIARRIVHAFYDDPVPAPATAA